MKPDRVARKHNFNVKSSVIDDTWMIHAARIACCEKLRNTRPFIGRIMFNSVVRMAVRLI